MRPRVRQNPGILFFALLTVLSACGEGAASPAPKAQASAEVPIQVEKVTSEEVSLPVRVFGTLAAKEEQRLAFKIGGVVNQLLVEEGATVRRGQLLATLDLSEIDAEVAKAIAGTEKAERDLLRAEKLEEAQVTTLGQRQDAKTAHRVAEQQLQIARFNRAHAVIVAPSGGKILRRLASAGELVAPGAPILILGATDQGWVLRANLTDRERVRVQLGDRAELRFDAFPEALIEAQVTELASAPEPQIGTYPIEIRLPKEDKRFVAGLFLRGELIPTEKQRFSFISPGALLEADGRRGEVYVLSRDRRELVRAPVILGPIRGARVAVLEGLEPGMEVVTGGAATLSPGASFRVVEPRDIAALR